MSLTPSFVENLLAGFVFWIFDVVVIVLLLPTFLAQLEMRKWKPMRQAIVRNINAYRNDCVRAMSRIDLSACQRPMRVVTFEQAERAFRWRMEILLPAVDPDLSAAVVTVIQHIETMNLLGRRFSEDLDYSINEFHGKPAASRTQKRQNYQEALLLSADRILSEVKSLDRMLAQLAKTYDVRIDGNVFIDLECIAVSDIEVVARRLRAVAAAPFREQGEA